MMLNNLRQEYDHFLAKQTVLLVSKKEAKDDNKRLIKEVKAHIEARNTIADVIEITQYKAKKSIEKTVTLAIRSVYDRPYTFHLDIVQKRNKIEYIPSIRDGDYIRDPKADMGGGIMDIVGLAFRAILQVLENPRTRSVLFLDQPFPNTGSLTPRAFAMAKELSRELPLQMLIITDKEDLTKIADRTWKVKHNGVKARVVRLLKRR